MKSITIGVFDGVHLGHSYIAKKTVECAKKHNLVPAAMIFAIPYKAISQPEKFDGLLTTADERIELLKKLGIEEIMVKDLHELMNVDAYSFIKSLIEDFGVKSIHVGHDFRFGKGALGDAKMLENLSDKLNFNVDVIPKIVKEGNRVSSSLIRYELKMGRPRRASSYLGRSFCIRGTVFRERGIGSKLGFPTANLKRPSSMLIVPKYGVYLVKSEINGEMVYGLLNVGKRPTIDGNKKDVSYEVYFIDKNLDLNGKHLRLELIDFLREEKKYPSISSLKDAISNDVKMAKNMIKNGDV